MGARAELIAVLELARVGLAHPDNDFAWSSWADADEALSELDGHIAALRTGRDPPHLDLEVLFAATGPIGEVAISSGWSENYLRLAERFDAAHTRFRDDNT